MHPILYKGLVDTGSSLLGAGVQQIFGERNMRLQQRYSKDMLKYQWDNQTPSVVNSLRKAGLNVGLMYNNGGPSVGSSTGHTTAPNIGNPLTGVGEFLNQAELVKSQVRLNDETSQLRKEETNYKKLDSINKAIENETDQEKKQNLIAEREKIYNDIEMDRRAADRADRKAESDIELNESNIALNNQQLQRDIEMLPIDKANKQSLTALNKANASGQYKQNEVREVLKSLYGSQAKNYDENTKLVTEKVIEQQFSNWYREHYGAQPSSGISHLVNRCIARVINDPKDTRTDHFGDRGLVGYTKTGIANMVKEVLNGMSVTGDMLNNEAKRVEEWLINLLHY